MSGATGGSTAGDKAAPAASPNGGTSNSSAGAGAGGGAGTNAASTNSTEKLPSNATGPTGSGTPGYKPFDYSQPLSTYSPVGATSAALAAGAARRSPVGTPGAGNGGGSNTPTSAANPTAGANSSSSSSSNAAAPAAASSSSATNAGTPGSTNPIAAGFAYGAAGQRTNGSGNGQQQQQQQQQGVGNTTPNSASAASGPNSAGANAGPSGRGAPAVQSRTGNNATPLTAPSIVSRTSGGSLPGSAAASPLGGAGSGNGSPNNTNTNANATGGATPTINAGPGSTAANSTASGGSASNLNSNKAGSPVLATAAQPARPPSASAGGGGGGGGGGGIGAFQSRYGQNSGLSTGGYTSGGGSPGLAPPGSGPLPTATRDPRTPNPVTELLSRSPVNAAPSAGAGAGAAAGAGSAASGPKRPSPSIGEQSRTGGIATPLAPPTSSAASNNVPGTASGAATGAANAGGRPGMPGSGTGPASSGKAGSPPGSANDAKRDTPGQSSAPNSSASGGAAAAAAASGQQPPHSASQMSWRSLLDRPYSSLYSQHQPQSVSSQPNRTQSPSQRGAGLWFNPLAMKQQQLQQQSSSSSAAALSQQQQQAHAHAHGHGHGGSQSPVTRPASGAPSGAGSPQQAARAGSGTPASTAAAAAAAAGATATGTQAQNQAAKRRTNSTSSAGPPYSVASVFGNRNPESGKESASPQARAVTASPVVGSAAAPSSAPPTSASATASAGAAASKGNSPAYQHRQSYSMAYGDRLQQLQAQSARERERERELHDREMREREKTAAAIVAGRTAGGASPPQTARNPYYGLAGSSSVAATATASAASKTSASPTLPASASPVSPQRRAAERPSSNSAFGYLFGGGGASRVATDGRSGVAPPTHFRPSSAQANQSVAQQVANYRAAAGQTPVTTSRTANTGLGLTSNAASPGWRSQSYGAANPAAATTSNASQPPPVPKQEPSPQPAPAVAPAQKVNENEAQAGAKRKRTDGPENATAPGATQATKAPTPVAQQPPPATLHAMRQREGPLFTAEDIKGAALRPPLMIVRSDNVVKALHKISSQHSAASATGQPTPPFLGRVFYDPFLDPADLLDADLLRKGVGGKVEIWLDTEWLKGEIWEAGAPSHPAVSHPPSPASEEFLSDSEENGKDEPDSQSMQIDGENGSNITKSPTSKDDLPPAWTLWDLPALRSRKIWGTDVYTDDSDILAACIHSGWLRLGSTAPLFGTSAQEDAHNAQKRRRRRKRPVLDHRSLCITIVVAPKLIKYEGSLRAGVWSRSWGNSHDGVSYAIESVQLVDHARHRLTTSRWKAFEKSQHSVVRQRCACPMGCEHSDKASVFSKSLKLGQLLGKIAA